MSELIIMFRTFIHKTNRICSIRGCDEYDVGRRIKINLVSAMILYLALIIVCGFKITRTMTFKILSSSIFEDFITDVLIKCLPFSRCFLWK